MCGCKPVNENQSHGCFVSKTQVKHGFVAIRIDLCLYRRGTAGGYYKKSIYASLLCTMD